MTLSLAVHGNGEERFIAIFGQAEEEFEAGIPARVLCDGHRLLLLCHPSRNAFAKFQPDGADVLGVGILGRLQYQFLI
jgi:hypothetical protein